MEVTSATTNTSAVQQPAAQSAYAQNKDRWAELAATVTDASGTYSDSERATAFDAMRTMIGNGQTKGMDSAGGALFEQAVQSELVQRVMAYQQREAQMAGSLIAAGRGDEVAGMQLKFFDSLSKADQQTYFTIQVNPTDMLTGTKRYSSIDGYRSTLRAQDQLGRYLASAQSDGKSAVSDATYAQTLKLASGSQNVEAWASQVLTLFSTSDDKITLSSEAKGILGEAFESSNPSKPARHYEPGSVASKFA
jgi:hypothetical protein